MKKQLIEKIIVMCIVIVCLVFITYIYSTYNEILEFNNEVEIIGVLI